MAGRDTGTGTGGERIVWSSQLSNNHNCLIITIVWSWQLSDHHSCLIITVVWCSQLSDLHKCLIFTSVWCWQLPDVHSCLIFTIVWSLQVSDHHNCMIITIVWSWQLSDHHNCLMFTVVWSLQLNCGRTWRCETRIWTGGPSVRAWCCEVWRLVGTNVHGNTHLWQGASATQLVPSDVRVRTTSLDTTRPSTIFYRPLLNWHLSEGTRNAPWRWQCNAETCRSYHT
jgi:hypothetical protein